jgi:hypothetical protein
LDIPATVGSKLAHGVALARLQHGAAGDSPTLYLRRELRRVASLNAASSSRTRFRLTASTWSTREGTAAAAGVSTFGANTVAVLTPRIPAATRAACPPQVSQRYSALGRLLRS